MFKSPLKVYGEYLIDPQAAAASITGTNVVRAGKSMSGLEVVVCVEGEDEITCAVGDTVTISLLHAQDGETFIAMPEWEQAITAPEDDPTATSVVFAPGSVIARMTLPYDCLPYIKGNLALSNPQGEISMFPSYLPR